MSQFGMICCAQVEDAFIPMDRETQRSRGFGFVTLEEEEGAKAAIEQVNEVRLI